MVGIFLILQSISMAIHSDENPIILSRNQIILTLNTNFYKYYFNCRQIFYVPLRENRFLVYINQARIIYEIFN